MDLSTSLIGRFDTLKIGVAPNVSRFDTKMPDAPYFRRQQFGLPFAANNTTGTLPWNAHATYLNFLSTQQFKSAAQNAFASAPIATVNILLNQRSARLTFVERLISDEELLKSYHQNLNSEFAFFHPHKDIGLLTDGWGDIFLVLFHEWNPPTINSFETYVAFMDTVRVRLAEVGRLQRAIFDNILVVRTETSYTPLAIDAALLRPDSFDVAISVRVQALDTGLSSSLHFERTIRKRLIDKGLQSLFHFVRTTGRTDYDLLLRSDVSHSTAVRTFKKLFEPSNGSDPIDPYQFSGYGIIFETLRDWIFADPDRGVSGQDVGQWPRILSTTTTISERICLLAKDTSPNK